MLTHGCKKMLRNIPNSHCNWSNSVPDSKKMFASDAAVNSCPPMHGIDQWLVTLARWRCRLPIQTLMDKTLQHLGWWKHYFYDMNRCMSYINSSTNAWSQLHLLLVDHVVRLHLFHSMCFWSGCLFEYLSWFNWSESLHQYPSFHPLDLPYSCASWFGPEA